MTIPSSLMTKNVAILGSTGSIGENALRVATHLGERVRVVGIAAHRRAARLAQQAAAHACTWAVAADPEAAGELRTLAPPGCRVASADALCDLVAAPEIDMVLCAIVGTAGLEPVLAAIRAGKDIALASKEILVMAGDLVMAEARRCGVRILPVDSEHSALFQCLEGRRIDDVRRLVLTASGGPFRELPTAALEHVTCAQALAHPTWNMGAKVTIDSATLMNKGLELIEAHWLFAMPPERLEVVVHPQAIVHSMVEFVDGGILAQMGVPDMCLPIQYALTWPERCPGSTAPLDLGRALRLDFEPPDHERFPALNLARSALTAGGTAPAVFNAANEVAVARFQAGTLGFAGIWRTVERVLGAHRSEPQPDMAAILAADAWARRQAAQTPATATIVTGAQ